MNPTPIIIAALNFLGSLLPQLPGLIDSIRASNDLSADGKALLDAMEARIEAHVARLPVSARPLPVPHEGSPTVIDPDPTPPA